MCFQGWKALAGPPRGWLFLITGALHAGNCSSGAGNLGLLLTVDLAGSLVAMAAAGLEPSNHFIHSSVGSESSQQESLGSGEEAEEEEGGMREEGPFGVVLRALS